MPEIPENIGPYRIPARIGEGGMGVVCKAQDQRLKRVVAPKVIREFDSDLTRRQRFWQEARTAAQVAYPNACRIYDIAKEQDRLVLVMEFIGLSPESDLAVPRSPAVSKRFASLPRRRNALHSFPFLSRGSGPERAIA